MQHESLYQCISQNLRKILGKTLSFFENFRQLGIFHSKFLEVNTKRHFELQRNHSLLIRNVLLEVIRHFSTTFFHRDFSITSQTNFFRQFDNNQEFINADGFLTIIFSIGLGVGGTGFQNKTS